ncbi:MAG: hypothetical protein K0Q74_461 [Gammaproteobacteria bacterium]|jgi:hypothetical protein|nr:hypothetical protein [Gammaproteobacteria bacterium]
MAVKPVLAANAELEACLREYCEIEGVQVSFKQKKTDGSIRVIYDIGEETEQGTVKMRKSQIAKLIANLQIRTATLKLPVKITKEEFMLEVRGIGKFGFRIPKMVLNALFDTTTSSSSIRPALPGHFMMPTSVGGFSQKSSPGTKFGAHSPKR